MSPYTWDKARIIVHEMADAAALDLVGKRMVTDQVVLTVGYESLEGQMSSSGNRIKYRGEVTIDRYGRRTPKHAHGTHNIGKFTSSGKLITGAALEIYDRTVNKSLLVRRIYVDVNHVVPEDKANAEPVYEQMDFFTDPAAREQEEKVLEKERQMQEAMLQIKDKFGKNAILKGVNFLEGATGRERNRQVGGHKE